MTEGPVVNNSITRKICSPSAQMNKCCMTCRFMKTLLHTVMHTHPALLPQSRVLACFGLTDVPEMIKPCLQKGLCAF